MRDFDKDFANWIEDSDMCADNAVLYSYMNYGYNNYDTFKALPFSMQWGAYQDFFDEVEDRTEVRMLGKVVRGVDQYFIDFRGNLTRFKTRQEARQSCFKTAKEIYNGRN